MAFRVLFWNIENFAGDDPARLAAVVEHIRATEPDIVGFSEIRDKAALRNLLFDALSGYDFGITDGPQGIELVAGWRRGLFEQALYTQRREFKAANPFLRPGALLSVRRGGVFYNFLFLHTDSGRQTRDYDNRQEMFESVWALRARLDEIEGAEPGVARFAVLGDLNTMGRSRAGTVSAVSSAEEVAMLRTDAGDHFMRLLGKSEPDTWARVDAEGEITLASDLDHALVSEAVLVGDSGAGAPVAVRGWPQAEDAAQRFFFVERVSDHASVEIVVQTPES